MNKSAKPDFCILTVTVGLPYSGKSTWAREQAARLGTPIVCPDAIRLGLHGQRFVPEAEPMVWAIAKTMVRALFHAGHRIVILDATNTTEARRNEWISEEWRTDLVVFKPGVKVCRKRALAAGDNEIIPIINRMSEQFEHLTHDELPRLGLEVKT